MLLNKAYIALGTNVGNWKNNFNQAVRMISRFGKINKISSVYISNPLGFKNQQSFYNSALELKTPLSVYFLWQELDIIEKKLHKNKLFKNGPRKIDLDIIFFNKLVIKSKKLKIPHQGSHLRDFVLLPLIEIIPFYIHPTKRKTIRSIYNKLEDRYVFKIIRRQKESLVIY